jgi:hypothetical protein
MQPTPHVEPCFHHEIRCFVRHLTLLLKPNRNLPLLFVLSLTWPSYLYIHRKPSELADVSAVGSAWELVEGKVEAWVAEMDQDESEGETDLDVSAGTNPSWPSDSSLGAQAKSNGTALSAPTPPDLVVVPQAFF